MARSLRDNLNLAWAQQQAFLALGNAVNGAKALGFDSCPITGFNPGECGRILDCGTYRSDRSMSRGLRRRYALAQSPPSREAILI